MYSIIEYKPIVHFSLNDHSTTISSMRILKRNSVKKKLPFLLGVCYLVCHARHGGGHLRIWQVDAHTALAGEAKTMLTRFSTTIGVGNLRRNGGGESR